MKGHHMFRYVFFAAVVTISTTFSLIAAPDGIEESQQVALRDNSYADEEVIKETMAAIDKLPENIRLFLFDELYIASADNRSLKTNLMYSFKDGNHGGAQKAFNIAVEAGFCADDGTIDNDVAHIIISAMRSSQSQRNIGEIIIGDPRAVTPAAKQARDNRARGCCILQ